jgi:hypothetical protein
VIRCAVGAAVAFALLVGCSSPAPQPTAPPSTGPPAAVPQPPKGPPIDLDKLDALLEKGDRAFKDNRLLTPIDNCAYDYYREALVVAPNHPAALHGLERIAERYVSMAEQAASREQYDKARQLLDRARVVDPDLDAGQLASRSGELSAQLKSLGGRAKARDSWVIIRAPTDADGRWIYQQMAAGSGERRIRAELTLGAPPAIELLAIAPTAASGADADADTNAESQ